MEDRKTNMSAGPAGPPEMEMRPHLNNAVAYLTPPNPEAATEAPIREPLITPEINGKFYDVRDDSHYGAEYGSGVNGAEAYLIGVKGRDLKKIRDNLDAATLSPPASPLRKEARQGQ